MRLKMHLFIYHLMINELMERHVSQYYFILHFTDSNLSQALKALSELLDEMRAQLQPKSRFAFKAIRKNDSAISLRDAAELISNEKARLNKDESSGGLSSLGPQGPPIPNLDVHTNPGAIEGASSSIVTVDQSDLGSDVRKPSLAGFDSVQLSNHSNLHIILPSSASHATSSGSVTHINKCIIDMSVPTATGEPFAGLALKNISESLLVCGKIKGPVHATSIENSTLVIASRQLRMHQCKNIDVYLFCSSRPIIEDCQDVRFAPLPDNYASLIEGESAQENLWDRVDDFNWLKEVHSPNWRTLAPEGRVQDQVWKAVQEGNQMGLDELLKKTIRDNALT
jgi:hypothetical protein